MLSHSGVLLLIFRVWELFIVVFSALTLAPMLSASCAHKYQVEFVFRRLCECDCLFMTTPFALHVLASGQSWVLDALWINVQVFSAHSEVCLVHTVFHLVAFCCSLIVVAHLTLELKVPPLFISSVLFGFQHVVTLWAEAHTLESANFLLGSYLALWELLRKHMSDLRVESFDWINYSCLKILTIKKYNHDWNNETWKRELGHAQEPNEGYELGLRGHEEC